MEALEYESVYAYLQFLEYPSGFSKNQKRVLRSTSVLKKECCTTLVLVQPKLQKQTNLKIRDKLL